MTTILLIILVPLLVGALPTFALQPAVELLSQRRTQSDSVDRNNSRVVRHHLNSMHDETEECSSNPTRNHGCFNDSLKRGGDIMAKNTGEDYRKGSVKERTQVENPRGEQWTKRDETPGSEKRGEFMEKKESGEPFKGVAKEKDDRRKSG